MPNDHLYTPWRLAYISALGPAETGGECVFCGKQHGTEKSDAANLIVGRSAHVYAMMNLYPYSSGHLMVIPYDHIDTQENLPDAVLLDIMHTVNKAVAVLRAVYKPHGFNLGVNLGNAAGAGIAGHYHFHVVPRWYGDANFMTTVGDTRVIPESHEQAQAKLAAAWIAL